VPLPPLDDGRHPMRLEAFGDQALVCLAARLDSLATGDDLRLPRLPVLPHQHRLENAVMHDVQDETLVDGKRCALVVEGVPRLVDDDEVFRIEEQDVFLARGAERLFAGLGGHDYPPP